MAEGLKYCFFADLKSIPVCAGFKHGARAFHAYPGTLHLLPVPGSQPKEPGPVRIAAYILSLSRTY